MSRGRASVRAQRHRPAWVAEAAGRSRSIRPHPRRTSPRMVPPRHWHAPRATTPPRRRSKAATEADRRCSSTSVAWVPGKVPRRGGRRQNENPACWRRQGSHGKSGIALGRRYFNSMTKSSGFAPSLTSISFSTFPPLRWLATILYLPGGTFGILKLPSAPVTAKKG